MKNKTLFQSFVYGGFIHQRQTARHFFSFLRIQMRECKRLFRVLCERFVCFCTYRRSKQISKFSFQYFSYAQISLLGLFTKSEKQRSIDDFYQGRLAHASGLTREPERPFFSTSGLFGTSDLRVSGQYRTIL